MRYLAIATDFDGVVASRGQLSSTAVAAIERLRASGRRAILVTGRSLENLQQSCSDLSAFDYAVVENGAVVYESRTRQEILLAQPLPADRRGPGALFSRGRKT
jgi:hydroxymethylpyrimidine pyrophosphatase-like HAD family hydrolase